MGGTEPDVVWQIELDPETAAREGRIAQEAPAFQEVMKHMGTLIRRFEHSTFREEHLFVDDKNVPATRSAPREPGQGDVRADRDPATEITGLQESLNAAWLRGDTATLGAIFAPDFRGIGSRGTILDRDRILRIAAHPVESATSVTDPVVRVLGDVAIYTAKITDSGKSKTGEEFMVTTWVTNVYMRRDAGWQIVAAHESLLAPPK
jgi:hypothetical protein